MNVNDNNDSLAVCDGGKRRMRVTMTGLTSTDERAVNQTRGKGWRGVLTLLLLFVPALLPAQAETILVGGGTGILWEGKPWNVNINNMTTDDSAGGSSGAAAMVTLGGTATTCAGPNSFLNGMATINGVRGMYLLPGVILVPRASFTAQYTLTAGGQETMSGTIGYPTSTGVTSGGLTITPVAGTVWCMIPKNLANVTLGIFTLNTPRLVTGSGTWLIIADGTQTTGTFTYSGAFQFGAGSNNTGLLQQIFPANVTFRVTNLVCAVATTMAINFGNVQRNTAVGSELASLSFPMTVSCSQGAQPIDANINVQLRALSGLYNGNTHQLALNQGGGYITGEIDGGVTGSGACPLNTGIPFDSTPLKVGAITSAQPSSSYTNQVTWRLCSGGASLPLGAVTASADLLVTLN